MKNANPVSLLFRGVVLALGLLLGSGCGRSDVSRDPSAVKTVTDFFPIQVGNRTVNMQLAIKPREMERGLMERRDLKSDDGMLFLYEKPQKMNFWMRNTPTALDIGFFAADGTLKEIYPLYPFDETTVSSRGEELVFALEMNQGWFEFHGVKPGAKLDLKALAAAVKARGAQPEAYGLK